MSGHSILVVGGAGYIGSHVVKVLRKQGYFPVVLDDLSTGHQGAMKVLDGVPFFHGCASDNKLVTKILRDYEIQSVMHFSAKALVAESVKNPLLYYNSNVTKTIGLLETLRDEGVRHFVFSSTCSTFGDAGINQISESATQNPINPYGRSKLMVEIILQDCFQSYGMSSAILRYFNAAGADPEGMLGEDHRPETHLLPLVIGSALGRRSPLMIYGNDYPTPDGTCIRDYIHVNDLADGHIRALEYIRKKPGCMDFNLGFGQGHSNLEIIHAVEKVTGLSLQFQYAPRRPGDPPILVADPSKAKTVLGWQPQFSLIEIIQTMTHWMKKNPRGYD